MSLQRRSYFVAALFAMIGLTLSGLILNVSSNVNEVKRDFEIVQAIHAKVADFRTVGVEYALYHEKRPKLQSEAMIQAISPLLRQLRNSSVFQGAETTALLQNAFDRLGDCGAIMSVLTRQTLDPSSAERERLMITQFLLRGAALASATGDLTRPLFARESHIQEMSQFVVITSVFFLLGLPLVAIVLLRRAVLHPLSKLANAVQAVGAGNRDIRLHTNDPGELGHLARAFDWMLDRVQEVTVSRDLLEQETSQRRQSEAKYRRLYESLHDAVVTIDMDGQLIEWNAVFRDLLGYADEDLPRLTMDNLTPGNRHGVPPAIMAEQVLVRGYSEVFEIDFFRKDGLTFPAEVKTFLLRYDAGETAGMWCLVRDISERKRLELAVRDKEVAEQANRAKSQFLAMMSHEVRTPITGVLGMADLLRRTSLNKEQAGYLDTLASSTKMLLTILNDILDISKIEAGKIVFEEIEFSLEDAVHDTLALCQGSASAKGLTLSHDILGDFPLRVIGDSARFKQLLFNLTGNAIKFTEVGCVQLYLSITARHEGGLTLLVEVKDTGLGIASDQLPLLFKPFSQLGASTTRRYGGTGLGLAITKRLVEMMGGRIGVESQEEKGSRFWFSLPFKVAPNQAALLVQAGTMTTPPQMRSLRILVAEDNRINQMLVRTMLQKMGHTIVVADNGRIAVEAVEAGEFDAVLMDMQMPEMDGEEATRAIRAMLSPKDQLPILALTADAMVEHRERYLAAGVNDLIPKPIDWQVLSEALAKHTGPACQAMAYQT